MPFKLRLSELHNIERKAGTGIGQDLLIMETRYIRVEVLLDDEARKQVLIEALGGKYTPPSAPEPEKVKLPKLYKEKE